MHYATNDIRTISRIMRATDVTVCCARCPRLTFSPKRVPLATSFTRCSVLSRVFTLQRVDERAILSLREKQSTSAYRSKCDSNWKHRLEKRGNKRIHENLHRLASRRVSPGASRFAYAIVPYVATYIYIYIYIYTAVTYVYNTYICA